VINTTCHWLIVVPFKKAQNLTYFISIRFNTRQSYTLQYGRIMEPIFARLGVKGTASNMGMGGLGTMHNSIAGSLYGRNVDILVWDSGMTEPSLNDQGIFATQGLLGSDRAPFLWFERVSSCLMELHKDMGADIGVYGSGRAILREAETFAALEQQPWAARYMMCNSEINSECKLEKKSIQRHVLAGPRE
jgi:hypothetical protein